MYFWIHSRNCRKNSNFFFQEHVLRVFVLFKRSVNSMMSRRNIKGFFVWHGKVFYVWCLVSLFEKGYYKVSPFLWFITHGYGRRTTKTYLSTLGEIHERGKKAHRSVCLLCSLHTYLYSVFRSILNHCLNGIFCSVWISRGSIFYLLQKR